MKFKANKMKYSKSKIALPYLLFASAGLVFLIMLSGCSLPTLKFQGAKQLQERETTDLIRYMKKHKIDTIRAFYIDKAGLVEILNKGIAYPASMEIMDNIGRVYTLHDSVVCSGTTKAFLADELNENRLKPSKDNTLYRVLSSSLYSFQDEKPEDFDAVLEKRKYTIVIFWSTYGQRNKQIENWQSTIDQNPDYQFITVNLDLNPA